MLAGTLILASMVVAVEVMVPVKDDVAWLIYVAAQWVDGRQPYVDVIELNPPPIIWFSVLPVLIGRLLNVSALQVMPVLSGLLMLGTAWWTAGIVVRRGVFVRRIPVFAAVALLLFLVPAAEFGQREHFIAAAALPYLALRLRPIGRGDRVPALEAAAVGLLVAVCCAIKPWYALAFLLVEGVMAARGGGYRLAAVMGAVLSGAAIAAAAAILHPDYLAVVVPLAMALYVPPSEPYRMLPNGTLLLLAALAFAACLWRWRRPARPDGDGGPILLLFALGATFAYFAQGRGWFYHRIPATAATVAALLLWAGLARPRLQRGAYALAALLLLLFAGQSGKRLLPRAAMAADLRDGIEEELANLLKREGAQSYLAFSNRLALGFPVVEMAGTAWASRFASMWAVRGEVLTAGRAVAPPTRARRWVVQDFLAACPDLVVVDTALRFDYPAILSDADPAFARAWSHYVPIGTIDTLRAYRRPPGTVCGPPSDRS